MKNQCLSLMFVVFCGNLFAQDPQYELSGEFKKWHKITLTFNGPETSEMDTYNPFLHYRLNVSFRHGKKTYTVPGYYAADGNAAETSADSGNKWRVHFAPDETGMWHYEVSFREGSNVAVDASPLAGRPGHIINGVRDSFLVVASDKTGRDLRAHGRLQYVRKPYLQFAESGQFFLKAGADAPENLLAYVDFDGDFKTDGHKDHFVKTWEAHLRDWKSGDPSWQNGKGKGLIGAVNYLASKGMNAFSFLPLNIAGDDENVFPYVSYNLLERLDVSKLDQWEILFEHADQLGMFLHFKTSEAENQGLLDGGDLGLQRKLYYRELIARFAHHLALNWNIGEENGKWMPNHPTPWQTTTQRLAVARYFHDTDPYQHHIVIHNGQQFYDLLGPESKYTGISLQTNREDFGNVHSQVLKWRQLSDRAGKPWAVAVDEPGDHRYSLVPDQIDSDHHNARQNALWGAFMAGAWGIEWYFGYLHEQSDLTCQDWRSRDKMWDQSRYALDFFTQNDIPYWGMEPADHLTASENDFVFCQKGNVYVIYQKIGKKEKTIIPNVAGSYELSWYNPRSGKFAGEARRVQADGHLELGLPPSDPDMDWVVLLRKRFTSIYNGKDFSGWYLYLRDRAKNEDPKKVFQILEDGTIQVSGEEFGYIMTEKPYGDFHLKLEFKWGDRKWAPRLDRPRDSGICYHIPGGTPDMIWPKSMECQIQEGDCGDFWMIDSTTIVIDGERSQPANFRRGIKKTDAELPHGQWNTVEVISIDGHNMHLVNGVLVNEGFDASVKKGRILIQSEGAEVYFRNIEIKDLQGGG